VTRRPLAVLLLLVGLLSQAAPALATSYVPISGAGSTWSQNALDQWRRNVVQYGIQVNYQGTGSSDGRSQFRNGTVDYAVSEIPYGLKDQGVVDNPPTRSYAYMPIVAGGTSFMYNLKIAGKRVRNLRLSGDNVARIFTGGLTMWNDPALQKDNPGLVLPARRIVPVVRSDGSGTTAQFTLWMSKQHQAAWDAYCAKAGIASPCGLTSTYPVIPGTGFTAQSGSLGVSGYVAQSQSEGAITYVEYSYALNTGFPVVKVLNQAGYYTEPTAQNVAVALLQARINTDRSSPSYLTQILDGVYNNADPRTYPLSSYSYMVVPTKLEGSFSTAKGRTLGDFAYYFLCEGQQQAPVLGYSPLPINLVKAGLEQVRNIPGVDAQSVDISKCNNPTFSASGANTLASTAPRPPACDMQGATQCGDGGAAATSTAAAAQAAARQGGTTAGAATQGGGTTAATGGGSAGAGRATTGGSAALSAGALVPGPAGSSSGAGTAPVVDGQQLAQGSSSADGALAGATPVAVAQTLGSSLQAVLVGLVVLTVLAVVVGPPLLSRRLAGRRAP
jgi:phosphate ABC transporter phosphate-binding protein